jgi:hypothetical protein
MWDNFIPWNNVLRIISTYLHKRITTSLVIDDIFRNEPY